MIELVWQALRLRSLLWVIVCGVLLSLATGLIKNQPEASIIGFTYYGYPMVWRVTKTLQPTEFRFTNLAVDAAFWIAISFLAFIFLEKIVHLKLGIGFKYRELFLLLVLFILLGLVMDFVHESGHVLWGIAVGGRLTYMKIAYFEIYPQFTITPQFCLGYVEVAGLLTEFEHGLFLLGGSLTTNIISWLLALILLKAKLRYRTRVALKILGLFGLLDLPFYVLFPQIGLRHWIIIGGNTPEPLLGARNTGIPDPVFYVMTVLTTLGLAFIYFKTLWEKAWKRIKPLSRSVLRH